MEGGLGLWLPSMMLVRGERTVKSSIVEYRSGVISPVRGGNIIRKRWFFYLSLSVSQLPSPLFLILH